MHAKNCSNVSNCVFSHFDPTFSAPMMYQNTFLEDLIHKTLPSTLFSMYQTDYYRYLIHILLAINQIFMYQIVVFSNLIHRAHKFVCIIWHIFAFLYIAAKFTSSPSIEIHLCPSFLPGLLDNFRQSHVFCRFSPRKAPATRHSFSPHTFPPLPPAPSSANIIG